MTPKIKAGDLLLSDPYMMDHTFKRSVILLCEHEPELGSIGFVLNRPLKAKMSELIDNFPEYNGTVYFGGPVAADTLHYIHTKGDILDESVYVGEGIYWGGDFQKLIFLMNSKLILEDEIMFFVGYSGWSEGQLDQEMKDKSWIVGKLDFNYVFGQSKTPLWKRVMKDLGEGYSVIANMSDSVSLN
jgi:putative transcriptional regulator